MKRILFSLVVLVAFMALPIVGQAYTINDSPIDGIGSTEGFESYGIDVNNFTPGVNSGVISFDIYTDYPEAGITAGAWETLPADLFITENYGGIDYSWAIPLVDHGTFVAGGFYAVGSVQTSTDFAPTTGGYIYTPDAPVWIDILGNNYGYSSFLGGSVTWSQIGDNPDYKIHIDTTIWEDDENATFDLYWGTATCGNDPVEGTVPAPVPEPATLILLGSGLAGLAFYRRKKK